MSYPCELYWGTNGTQVVTAAISLTPMEAHYCERIGTPMTVAAKDGVAIEQFRSTIDINVFSAMKMRSVVAGELDLCSRIDAYELVARLREIAWHMLREGVAMRHTIHLLPPDNARYRSTWVSSALEAVKGVVEQLARDRRASPNALLVAVGSLGVDVEEIFEMVRQPRQRVRHTDLPETYW